METHEKHTNISSIELATAITKRIAEAGFIEGKNFNFAVEIADEEITVRRAIGDYFSAHRNPISSDDLADLIVDAMHSGKTVNDDNFDKAVEIARLEIDIRKTACDY